MYTDNTRWGALFVSLSLLSTGLSIVAAGLLVDYSTSLLHESELFNPQPKNYAAISTSGGFAVDQLWTSVPGNGSLVRINSFVQPQENAAAFVSSIEQSLLVEVVRDEIARRARAVDKRARRALVVLKPAAPDIEVNKEFFRAGPRSMEILSGNRPTSRGG